MFSTGTGIAPFASLIRDPKTYETFDEVILTHTCREDYPFQGVRRPECRPLGDGPLVWTCTVTTANWNDPVFWFSINELGPGHTLDFYVLTSDDKIDLHPDAGRINIVVPSSNYKLGQTAQAFTPPPILSGNFALAL